MTIKSYFCNLWDPVDGNKIIHPSPKEYLLKFELSIKEDKPDSGRVDGFSSNWSEVHEDTNKGLN